MRILINAIHTHTGGGLAYLNGVLSELAKHTEHEWLVVTQEAYQEKIHLPENVTLRTVNPPRNGLGLMIWEQLKLPALQKKWECEAMFCNANYGPFRGKNVVITIHNNPAVGKYTKQLWLKLYWFFLPKFTRLNLCFAQGAVSVAEHIIPTYAKGMWKKLSKKIAYAPPAVNLQDIRVTLPVRDKSRVVAVGDFYVQKDYPTMLQAFKVLLEHKPDVTLEIIGRPIEPYTAKVMERFVEEHHLSDKITFRESLPHNELLGTLATAGVYFNTSLVECFNMPVLEALALGVPTVVADLPFQKEVAGEAALYVPVDRGGDIAAAYGVAVYGMLENDVIAEQFRKKGIEQAQKFSWQRTADTIISALEGKFS